MKFLLFIAIFYSSLFSRSQTIYGSISGGYQFGVGKQNLEHHSVSDFIDSYSPWPWQQVDLSLGKGIMTTVSLGYYFKQNYGFALSGSYLFGAEFSSKINKSNSKTVERLLSASMTRINPSFKMYVGEKGIRTYADVGFIVGLGEINLTNKMYSEDTTYYAYKYKYYGGVSFGASARFGIEYNLSDKIQLIGEFNFISHSYAPRKGRLVEYIINNQSVMDQVDDYPYSTEIVFVQELQTDPTISPELGEPAVRARHSYPFHSYGINIGVKYILWTKKKEESTEN